MAAKKIPMRMCTGCREMRQKKELTRIVRNHEGIVSIDPVGKAPGRGAYICKDPECLLRAKKTRALERALEAKIDPQIYERLLTDLTQNE